MHIGIPCPDNLNLDQEGRLQDHSKEPTPPPGESIVPLLRAKMRAFLLKVVGDPGLVKRGMLEYDNPTTEIESPPTAVDRGGKLLDLTGPLAKNQGRMPGRRQKTPRGSSPQH